MTAVNWAVFDDTLTSAVFEDSTSLKRNLRSCFREKLTIHSFTQKLFRSMNVQCFSTQGAISTGQLCIWHIGRICIFASRVRDNHLLQVYRNLSRRKRVNQGRLMKIGEKTEDMSKQFKTCEDIYDSDVLLPSFSLI